MSLGRAFLLTTRSSISPIFFLALLAHRVPETEMIGGVRDAGCRPERDLDFLERQGFLIFPVESG